MKEWQKWIVVIIELAIIAAVIIFAIVVLRDLGITEGRIWQH